MKIASTRALHQPRVVDRHHGTVVLQVKIEKKRLPRYSIGHRPSNARWERECSVSVTAWQVKRSVYELLYARCMSTSFSLHPGCRTLYVKDRSSSESTSSVAIRRSNAIGSRIRSVWFLCSSSFGRVLLWLPSTASLYATKV